jgi:methyl-accepting chemotaxis protein
MQQLLTAGFGLLLAVFGAFGILSVEAGLKSEYTNSLAALDAQRALLAEHLIMLQQRQQATSRAYFLDPAQDAHQRFESATNEFASTLDQLQQLTNDAAGIALLAKARTLCNSGTAETESLFALEAAGHHDGVIAELAHSVGLSKQIRQSLDDYKAYSVENFKQRLERQRTASNRAIWLSSLFLALGVLVAIGCAMTIIRVVGKRVRGAQGAIAAIARHDLSGKPIRVTTDDNLGKTLTAVNLMRQNLSDVVGSMLQIAGQLSKASGTLATASTEHADGAQKQRMQAEQFAISLREMSEVVTQVAQHAGAVALAADRADDSVRQGDQAVSQTVAKIEQIAVESSEVNESIRKLEISSQQISSAANLIRGIAEQTNLLALNAAIEAARAGEQGKGFSVVAAEVRRLAERTAVATCEIDQTVSVMAQQTEATMQKTRGAQMRVSEGVTLASGTRESLVHVQQAIGEVEQMTVQIAAATSQQAASTRELQQSLDQIVMTMTASAAAAEHSSEASRRLSELSDKMNSDKMNSQFSEFVLPQPEAREEVPLIRAVGACA